MLSIVYADCLKEAVYTQCHNAECCGAIYAAPLHVLKQCFCSPMQSQIQNLAGKQSRPSTYLPFVYFESKGREY
jgi:hypothetical protein